MIARLNQHGNTRRVRFDRIVISLILAACVIASGVLLNLVGHAKFIQTDRVLLVPIGKTVWSYGWPFRWMEKDIAEVEIEALRKDKKSDGVFRTRWGIHHASYDWVNRKYYVSIPALCLNVFAIIALLVGTVWAEYRSIVVARLKSSPIAILLCCLILLWRLFGRSPFFADPIEFKLLRAIEFASNLVLVAFSLEIVMLAIRWISKKSGESTRKTPESINSTNAARHEMIIKSDSQIIDKPNTDKPNIDTWIKAAEEFAHGGKVRTARCELTVLNLSHLHPAGVAEFFLAELVGVNDLGDVLFRQLVLTLALNEVFSGVDEEHVVRFFALLQHQDADRDAGGVEQIGWQADDGVDVAVLEQFGADACLGTATEEYAVRQDDGHDAFVFEVMESVQKESEVGGGLRGQAVVLKTHIIAQGVGRFPTVEMAVEKKASLAAEKFVLAVEKKAT